MPKLEGLIKGSGRKVNRRLPITLEILRKLRDYFQARSQERDAWAAISTCFVRFLRSGEITIPSEAAFDSSSHLCLANLSTDSVSQPSMVKLRLKASKTDPFMRGVEIYSPWKNEQFAVPSDSAAIVPSDEGQWPRVFVPLQ